MIEGILDIARVSTGRRLVRVGRDIEAVFSTSSTNDHAWQRGREGVSDGYTVFAEQQTAGRGRMGRTWTSPTGAAVLCSVLLRESSPLSIPDAELVGLITGIACAHALRDAAGIDARILWPNDIVVGRRKIAGVLVETGRFADGEKAVVVGVGINCLQHAGHFPAELRERATSVEIESPSAVRREDVAAALLCRLDAWFADPDRWDPETVRRAFVATSAKLGRTIRLRHADKEYHGQVVDVDPSAALVVQMDDGMRRLFPTAGTTLIDAYDAISTD